MENLATLTSLKSFRRKFGEFNIFITFFFFYLFVFLFVFLLLFLSIFFIYWFRSKNNYYCIYCSYMLKTYQGEAKLFEFSQDMNRAQLKIRKNNVTLQWLRFNGFLSKYLTSSSTPSKLQSFLMMRYAENISPLLRTSKRQWKSSISCTNVFIMTTGQWFSVKHFPIFIFA